MRARWRHSRTARWLLAGALGLLLMAPSRGAKRDRPSCDDKCKKDGQECMEVCRKYASPKALKFCTDACDKVERQCKDGCKKKGD